MNYKVVEKLMTKQGKIDKKCKLNRLNKVISEDVLDKIDGGITSEELNTINLPIYKYSGQITIHGKFEFTALKQVLGYKSIFQNKNKSIGVKWVAIDEDKRQTLKSSMKYLGFYYKRNSSEHSFNIDCRIYEDDYKEVINKYKTLLNKFDNSLFYGGYNMFIGKVWGQTYLVIELVINAIAEKDIAKLLKPFQNDIAKAKVKEQEEKRLYEIEKAKEKKAREKKAQELTEEHKWELEILKKDYTYYKSAKPFSSTFITIRRGWDNTEYKFIVSVYHKRKAQKLFRRTQESFNTLADALNSDVRGSDYHGTKINSISGYRIK